MYINCFSIFLLTFVSQTASKAFLEKTNDQDKDNNFKEETGEQDPVLAVYDINETALKVLEAKEGRIENGEDVTVEGDLAPSEHLEGIRINRHGKKNEKYDEEVFLGEEIEKFEDGDMSDEEKEEELRKIFELIDTNHNGFIEEDELALWVLTKTREHFDSAKQKCLEKFQQLDSDQNGLLEWEEYLIEYIAQKGLDWEKFANKLTLKESVEANIPDFLRDDFEGIRDSWIEVAHQGELYADEADEGEDEEYRRKVNTEDPLTYELFVEFQHPETSELSLKWIVEDFIEELDKDQDGFLTLEEYRGMEAEEDGGIDQEYLLEREEEFKTLIDSDGDGKATPDEIKNFLDPMSKANAHIEARQLIGYGDDNQDYRLSVDEVISNSEFFIDTKLYKYSRAMHYEL